MINIFQKKAENEPKNDRATLGAAGEHAAAEYLHKKGFQVLEKNYRVKGGEIDIIANEGGEIVFVEVKTRQSTLYGYPEEAVSYAKEWRMARAMRHYLSRLRNEPAYRVDIVSVVYPRGGAALPEIVHIPSVILRVTI